MHLVSKCTFFIPSTLKSLFFSTFSSSANGISHSRLWGKWRLTKTNRVSVVTIIRLSGDAVQKAREECCRPGSAGVTFRKGSPSLDCIAVRRAQGRLETRVCREKTEVAVGSENEGEVVQSG